MEKVKTKLSYFLFLIILLVAISCNTTEPPPPPDGEKPTLAIALDDASCTEAWLQLTTKDLELPAELTLKQYNLTGDSLSKIFLINTKDSLLYIDSLLPNQTYTFVASHSGLSGISSNELSVATMDTTSHNFTFETFTYGGDAGSCVLYDCAIISLENIWCVGEINIADTSINGYTTYNAVHWDGNEWELKRVYFPSVCGQSSLTSFPAKTIFAFDDGQIWISSTGDKIAIIEDGIQIDKFCLPWSFSINKIWGTSSNNLYIVGNDGNIAHFQNGNWTRIISGTYLDFLDIYGATDPKTGEQQILAVCTRNYPLGNGIYLIEGNTATEISSNPIEWELFGVWFIPRRHYYVLGSGIYEKKFLSDSTWKNSPLDITHYGTSGIRGNDLNDVFVAGSFGEFLHFNGVSWKSYINETGLSNGGYGKVAVKNNLVIAVGLNNGQAVIIVGRR